MGYPFTSACLLSCLLMLTGCEKQDEEEEEQDEAPPTAVPDTPVLDLTSITSLDFFGDPVGSPDPGDWLMDVELDSTEAGYFPGTHDLWLLPNSTENYIAFYANPVQSGLATLRVRTPRELRRFQLVYVDQFAHVVASDHFNVYSDDLDHALDLLSAGGLLPGDYFRLYYRALSEDSVVYLQGYGDFQMNN